MWGPEAPLTRAGATRAGMDAMVGTPSKEIDSRARRPRPSRWAEDPIGRARRTSEAEVQDAGTRILVRHPIIPETSNFMVVTKIKNIHWRIAFFTFNYLGFIVIKTI